MEQQKKKKRVRRIGFGNETTMVVRALKSNAVHVQRFNLKTEYNL